jgi:hypothetical protein
VTLTTAPPVLPARRPAAPARPRPTTLTVSEARRTRRTILEQIVARGAACAGIPMEFYRVENEPLAAWKLRREYLICAFCIPCPVREACEETALRAGEGEETGDSMVRGGFYSEDLFEIRVRQRARLRRAVAADQACTR